MVLKENSLPEPQINQKIRPEGGTMNKKTYNPIDEEEKELMESMERDDWQPVKNFDEEKKRAMAAARNTLKKDKRINLRLTQKDYHQIQIKAIMFSRGKTSPYVLILFKYTYFITILRQQCAYSCSCNSRTYDYYLFFILA